MQWSSLSPRRLKQLFKPRTVEDNPDAVKRDTTNGLAPHLLLGERGERLAAEHLVRLGYSLVAANFILPVGRNLRGAIVRAEIDLIAYEGSTLCFIEVKTRASDWFAAPEANVDLRKQRQISRAARRYRRLFDLEGEPFRYDVVSVVLPEEVPGEAWRPRIEVIRNYWTEEKFRKRRWPGAPPEH